MEGPGAAPPSGAAAEGQPAVQFGAGVEVHAASQEWGDDDSSDEDGSPSGSPFLRRASTRQLRLATSSGQVEDIGAARRLQARHAAGQAVLDRGTSSSSEDDGKPHIRRRRKFADTPTTAPGTDEIKVQGSANEWAAMEESSSEDSARESPTTIVSARHERYKRLAQELEANQTTATHVEPPKARSGELVYICRYIAFSFPFVAYISVDWALLFATLQCDGHPLGVLLLVPPCLFLKVMEAALAWTEPALVRPRRSAWRQSQLLRWALFVLLTLGLLGGCYFYRLFLAHRRAAKHKRTFLLELESLDPSRQLLADDVRWDNDDLLWGPFVVVGLVSLLAHGSCARGPLGLHQALVWAFPLLVVLVSVVVAVVNFDYCASHHIRTEYGMVFDDCRWVRCVRTSGREKRSKVAHRVYRVLEVVGRVLVLVVGALAATQHPRAVVCLALADYFIVTRRACHLSRPSAEALLLSIPSFIVDLSRYIDEPGFALPARRLSRTIRAVRQVELLAAAAVLVWWIFSDVDLQLAVLRADRLACATLLGLLIVVHAAFFATGMFAEVCQPPGDVFTSVIDGDLRKVEWSLSSPIGCTEKTVCAKTRQTALHVAAENGQLECARLLLSKRADPAALDTNRDNVLHIACRRGNLQLAELLLEGGTVGTADVPRSHARSRSAPAFAAGGGGAAGAQEDEKQREAQTERMMNQPNEQAQLPKDVICRRAPPRLLELLEHHEEGLLQSGLVASRQDGGHGARARADSDVVDRPRRTTSTAASSKPSITSSLSAPNTDRRTSMRASIFGNVLGGDHFNIQAGPRPQVQPSRLDLASFICERSMGEQYERLSEIWAAMRRGEGDSAICLSYLRTVSTLGAGGFGRVMKVQDLRNGNFYALKLQKKDKAAKQAVREARAMLEEGKLCPFIVEAKRIFHTTGFYGIVMEFCAMDLNVRILQGRGADAERELDRDLEPVGGLPVDIAGRYTACVMLALEHLHGRSMVFRDLKPENVLITSSKEYGDVAKLADFGMARSLQNILTPQSAQSPVGHRLTMKAGTPAFMSAEAISDETLAEDSRGMHWYASRDWYGLGCCVLLMLLAEQGGRKIYHGSRQVLLPAPQEDILSVVMEAMGKDLITEDVFELVTGLTDVRVNHRWNQDELRRSPFLFRALEELDPEGSDRSSSSSGSAEDRFGEEPAEDPGPEPFPELAVDLSLEGIDEAKKKGNESFSQGCFEDSVKWFSKAIWLAEQWRGLKAPADQKSMLRSNRAFALLRLERWAEAEADCSEALGLNGNSVKAHYRRAMARLELGMAEDALRDVDRVLEACSNNAGAAEEAVELRRRIEEKLKEQPPDAVAPSIRVTPPPA